MLCHLSLRSGIKQPSSLCGAIPANRTGARRFHGRVLFFRSFGSFFLSHRVEWAQVENLCYVGLVLSEVAQVFNLWRGVLCEVAQVFNLWHGVLCEVAQVFNLWQRSQVCRINSTPAA